MTRARAFAPALSTREGRLLPNRWDVLALLLLLAVAFGVVEGSRDFAAPLATNAEAAISLSPGRLPGYALRTTLRMAAAMAASLVFTLSYATVAARSRRAERVMIPLLDILQSVPVLGYLSLSVTLFLALFPGRMIGAELAAIFAIFTSQVWNMTFSFYQSLRTVPSDLEEVSRAFHFSRWIRFWRLDVPFAMPGLLWNAMMSMSGGWFFVVASEAIVVGSEVVSLPGVGSYVALAIRNRDLHAIGWAIATMAVVILIYDQLVFRPLTVWSERFRYEQTAGFAAGNPWLVRLLLRTRALRRLGLGVRAAARWAIVVPATTGMRLPGRWAPVGTRLHRLLTWLAYLLAACLLIWGLYSATATIRRGVDPGEVVAVVGLGFLTLTRVMVLVALASLVWVPVGVWVGLRPRWTAAIQPIAQFMAAFPANLLFPLVVVGIVRFDLRPGVWLSPLMILGAQWYILFNVIAGASTFPTDLRDVAGNLGIRGRLWWQKVILPGVFPYSVTGALTAAGGAWNASIIAETASWGSVELTAAGLGAYIAHATRAGDFPRLTLGIAVMAAFVVIVDRLLWRRLYRYAERRLRMA